jgi:hypothetical protein
MKKIGTFVAIRFRKFNWRAREIKKMGFPWKYLISEKGIISSRVNVYCKSEINMEL